jgi:arginyl-tRNA synthetase
MYTLEKIKQHIVDLVNKECRNEIIAVVDLTCPPNSEMGDLSLPCFKLAKTAGKSPAQIAEGLFKKIKPDEIITSVKTVGPYLNFILNKEYVAKNLFMEICAGKDQYGKNGSGDKKRVMIEYSNVNTHKEYHVGHLRNISYGDAINRILAANGFESVPVSYINDFGIHVAKTLWNYDNFIKENYGSVEKIPEEKRGFVLGKMYVDATRRAEEDKLAKQMIGGIMKEIESRRGAEYELWKKTREWSIAGFDKIYEELGVRFEKIIYENEVIGEGKKIVAELVEKKILKQSDGAIIADLEKYNLGVLVVIRTDGTMLYPVADFSLAKKKFDEFNIDKSIVVVDVRQGQYFKQLFKILELWGYKKEMVHLGFEFVKLPSGMMSSRTGNVITYQELRDEIFAHAEKETRSRHTDWSSDKIQSVVKEISIGAMKFEMIKVSASSIITFDIEKALSFDGYTAAYLQYTFARIQSILKKAENFAHAEASADKQKSKKIKIDNGKLAEPKEHELILKLAKYPDVIGMAGKNYDPSEIAKYIFELAQSFNDYYHAIPVLKAEEDAKNARLVLISAVAQVVRNGLSLLGIGVVEEM